MLLLDELYFVVISSLFLSLHCLQDAYGQAVSGPDSSELVRVESANVSGMDSTVIFVQRLVKIHQKHRYVINLSRCPTWLEENPRFNHTGPLKAFQQLGIIVTCVTVAVGKKNVLSPRRQVLHGMPPDLSCSKSS